MSKTIAIHGHNVNYDEDAFKGVHYLINDLQSAEAKVHFEYAKYHGEAQFEDNHEHQFSLQHHNGTYTLVRR